VYEINYKNIVVALQLMWDFLSAPRTT